VRQQARITSFIMRFDKIAIISVEPPRFGLAF